MRCTVFYFPLKSASRSCGLASSWMHSSPNQYRTKCIAQSICKSHRIHRIIIDTKIAMKIFRANFNVSTIIQMAILTIDRKTAPLQQNMLDTVERHSLLHTHICMHTHTKLGDGDTHTHNTQKKNSFVAAAVFFLFFCRFSCSSPTDLITKMIQPKQIIKPLQK